MWVQRACSYIPVNVPVLIGMLCTPPTIFNIALWQWINSTYNAGLNYGNRNTSAPCSTKDTLIAYFGASATAIGVSLALRQLTTKMIGNRTGAIVPVARAMTMYLGAATANFVNVYLMRQAELKTGIMVNDELGEEMGISNLAAKNAVFQTALSRFFLAAPPFLIPAVGAASLHLMGMMPNAFAPKLIVDVMLIAVGLRLACPMGSSLFQQITSLPADQLEQEFMMKENSKGDKIRTFYFNKGL